MVDKVYPNSQLPIRKSSELLPETFRTDANDKFLSGVVDPLVQPGALDMLVEDLAKLITVTTYI